MANWIDELFNKKVSKTAEQTDAKQEFTKKVKASGWVDGVMGIDEPAMAKEAEAKMEAEIAVHKEAAYEAFQDTEEVLKQDYARDASILSDFTLASMVAEMRGHAKQDFMENATEYFEQAKKDVKADRKGCEKELVDGSGMSAQLDWRKSFEKYKKEEKPTEAKEKELYKSKLEDVNDDLSKGGKPNEYSLTDEQHAKTTQGLGREEKERTDVTQEAGEVHKDASLNKEADLLQEFIAGAKCALRELNERGATCQLLERALDKVEQTPAASSPLNPMDASLKTAALVRDPDTELKLGTIVRLARTVMTKEGFLLPADSAWEITAIEGFHYTISANGKNHTISYHDTPKFNKLASLPEEIANHATKEEVLTKLAEIQSPWEVRLKDGKEVIALVAPEQTNTKESEETKKEDIQK